MLRRVVSMLAGAGLVAAMTLPAGAATGSIASFTKTSSGNISFAVHDIQNAALPGSQGFGFDVQLQTSFTRGTVTVTAPSILGTAGNKIPRGAFSASCVESVGQQSGIYTSLGVVRLSASPVTCGQIASNSNGEVQFTVNLFLDDTGDSTAFSADTYSTGLLTVTVNAP